MRLLLSLILIAASTHSLAGTAVINGATLEGNTLTITGSNFEPENPMLFWDDASTNMQNSGKTNGDKVPTSPTTEEWQHNTNMVFKTAADSKTANLNTYYYGKGHKGYLLQPNHAKPESLKNKLFVSWWYKPGASPSAEGGSNKFIRIWDEGNGNGTRISWTQMHFTCAESTTWGSWNGNVNQWNHHMINVDLTAGIVKTWVNGKLLIDSKCLKTVKYPDNYLYVGLIGFDHGSEAYRTMETSIDDIYIATSPARVEVSESATWSETMKREVLPITSWNSTKIVVKKHIGAVIASNRTYLYIYDANGISNKTGFKIKCDKCPQSPESL
jgi:hypothetical protein